ncbi:hypothetical protein HU773_019065 [Pseudomonas shahriarae]|uniref:hypothetical protein n=1 Tax=Pseudomonas shahriarae TaxID=2745512 RepID=UPI0016490101|nr:hypothetical protein [Pseudomonas shahriarae]QXH87754.1 hypothetical protein HU773_019065 [Pseudomonas shahriarae]
MFNVTRSETAPITLALMSWRGKDIAEALRKDFLNKCYLCETKDPLSFNVEHFESRRDRPDMQFEWSNLFFSCARCNNFKAAETRVVDCTNPNLDVCRLIKHSPPVTAYGKEVIVEAMSDDPLVVETAELLGRIYNQEDTGNRMVAGAYLRKRIFKKYYSLLEQINIYEDDEGRLDSDRDRAFELIKNFMHKKQEFSAFLRWAVLLSPHLQERLDDYID